MHFKSTSVARAETFLLSTARGSIPAAILMLIDGLHFARGDDKPKQPQKQDRKQCPRQGGQCFGHGPRCARRNQPLLEPTR